MSELDLLRTIREVEIKSDIKSFEILILITFYAPSGFYGSLVSYLCSSPLLPPPHLSWLPPGGITNDYMMKAEASFVTE